MHGRRRLLDAIRSPARVVALIRRVFVLWRRGELRAAVARASAQGYDDRRYRAWSAIVRATASAAPDSVRGGRVRFVLLLDFKVAAASVAAAGLARVGQAGDLVLAREADGRWRSLAADAPGAPGAAQRPAPLADWLPSTGSDAATRVWLLWIAEPVRVEGTMLAQLESAILSSGAACVVYTDDDRLDAAGRAAGPRFKSAWDRERILETNDLGRVLALDASLAGALPRGRRASAGDVWRCLVALRARIPAAGFLHLPRVLVHRLATVDEATDAGLDEVGDDILAAVARDGDSATLVTGGPRPGLRFAGPSAGRVVSIVIPTRDRVALLRRCVESIAALTPRDRYELVIVDNDSAEPAARAYLAGVDAQVIPAPGAFNFARLCNLGATAARGDVVVLLNNDTVIVDAGWLDELASLALRRSVGAVGPLLLYENGRVQSAGVFLGVNRTSSNVLAGYAIDSVHVRAWCAARRRVSAVNGACLAVAATRFKDVGGFDETFAVSHNELDLCLRLEAAGFATIFTPHARVIHVEGGTRGYELAPDERRRLEREEAAFTARWAARLAQPDPAHNPNLAVVGDPFSLAPAGLPRPRAGWPEPPARTA
jgi:GT2 family glycosyltransferase